MTSTNPTEAEEDLLTEDGGTHDAQSTHELPETQQPSGTGKDRLKHTPETPPERACM